MNLATTDDLSGYMSVRNCDIVAFSPSATRLGTRVDAPRDKAPLFSNSIRDEIKIKVPCIKSVLSRPTAEVRARNLGGRVRLE